MASDLNISPVATAPSNSVGTALTQNLLGKKQPVSPEQIDKISHDFETEFAINMLQPMVDSASTDWFGGQEGEDVYKSMMVRQLGTVLANSGKLGVADMVKKELLQLQEVQQASQNATQVMKGTNPGS